MIISAKSSRVSAAFLCRHPAHFIALGFGTGLAPKAPGTFGTLLAYPIFFGLIAALSLTQQLAVVVALFLLGVWCCAVTGGNLGVIDHGAIVWDEVVAMLLVLTFTPFGWMWYVVAFALFRIFDILKPFPIGLADRTFKNGFGVMFDDLLAAIYSIAAIKLLERWMNG